MVQINIQQCFRSAILCKLGVNGGGTRYTLNFDGAKIRLDNGGGAATTTATYADGFWHHIVAIKPNNGNIGNVVHYVDGVVSAHGGSGGSTFNISESQIFLSVLTVPVQTGLILLVQ